MNLFLVESAVEKDCYDVALDGAFLIFFLFFFALTNALTERVLAGLSELEHDWEELTLSDLSDGLL